LTERNIQVKTPTGWRTVGRVVDINGVPSFYREVSRSKHLLRTFSAWGMQASLLPVLEESGVKWFYLYDKESKQTVRISIDDFRDKSVKRRFRDGGDQLFVSEKYFTLVPGMKRISKRPKQVELVA
jgi:hypothetical protein